MKKALFLLAFLPAAAAAQERYMTRTGHIEFTSSTPIETFTGTNDKVTSVWDATAGNVEFAALVKAFAFEKALMQEHFNENYMESNTYPKATFKGRINGVSAEQLTKAGTYSGTVEGMLTIHGVERPHKGVATITSDGKGGVQAVSELKVRPEDHGIKIPGVVRKQIAEEVEVKVRMDYTRM